MRWCNLPACAFAGMLLALCAPTTPFEVRVVGTPSEVGYGGTLLLNCSSTCPPPGGPGGLETPLSKEWVGEGPGWVSVRLWNVTQPHSDVLCYFSCQGRRKVVTFTVLAYALVPSPPPPPRPPAAPPGHQSPQRHPAGAGGHRVLGLAQSPPRAAAALVPQPATPPSPGTRVPCACAWCRPRRTMVLSSGAKPSSAWATGHGGGARPPSRCTWLTSHGWTTGAAPPGRTGRRGRMRPCAARHGATPRPSWSAPRMGTPSPPGCCAPSPAPTPAPTAARPPTRWGQLSGASPSGCTPTTLTCCCWCWCRWRWGVGALAGAVGYRIYYRKKKIRRYRLQEQQKRLQLDAPKPPGCSEETTRLNGPAQP
ncbi:uncharacterized protein LOC121082148 [Falco naumanni]|uniref:uncharacterized protein LOC121082148 n=1 Tax=Falco naumanni TaxID=148594 RepID=UPI001ADEBA83|nr:uncharacterized protein LOC121082148 [Falco naumanni]